MATSLKARAMLKLAFGCGLRAGEVVRPRAGDIDSEQMIIRIVQSKGRKDRHVMLPAEPLTIRQFGRQKLIEQQVDRAGGPSRMRTDAYCHAVLTLTRQCRYVSPLQPIPNGSPRYPGAAL